MIELDSIGHKSLVVLYLGDAVGKELGQPFNVLGGKIGRVQFSFSIPRFLKISFAKCQFFGIPNYFTLRD